MLKEKSNGILNMNMLHDLTHHPKLFVCLYLYHLQLKLKKNLHQKNVLKAKLRSFSVKLVLSLFEPINFSPLLADEKVEYKITASHKINDTILEASNT